MFPIRGFDRPRFFAVLGLGHFFGIPWCCRLRYAFREARDPGCEQAAERGIRFGTNLRAFVPCGVLHRAALSVDDFKRIVAGFAAWPPPELDPDDESW